MNMVDDGVDMAKEDKRQESRLRGERVLDSAPCHNCD